MSGIEFSTTSCSFKSDRRVLNYSYSSRLGVPRRHFNMDICSLGPLGTLWFIINTFLSGLGVKLFGIRTGTTDLMPGDLVSGE